MLEAFWNTATIWILSAVFEHLLLLIAGGGLFAFGWWRRNRTILLIAAAVGFGWLYGEWQRGQGREACEAQQVEDTRELNAELDRLMKKHRDLSRAYQAMLDRNDALQSELDDAALQDPDADRPAFGADSVQRLNQIR